MFLRKQSRNSLANWWSVCFKMFFSNGFICGVASTGSATVYENYFYALLFYFLNAKFLLLNCFLSMLSWRNSFAMKLYGNCYLNRLFSITKFTEMWWNDGVFEGSEEHRRFFTMLRFVQNDMVLFLLTIRNLNYFWNAKVFYYSYVFKEAKREFASELMKRVF